MADIPDILSKMNERLDLHHKTHQELTKGLGSAAEALGNLTEAIRVLATRIDMLEDRIKEDPPGKGS